MARKKKKAASVSSGASRRRKAGGAKKAVSKAPPKSRAKRAVRKTPSKAAPRKAAPRKAAAKKTATRKAATRKTAKKATPKKATKRAAQRKAAAKKTTAKTRTRTRTRSSRARTPRRGWKAVPGAPPGAISGLSEEDQIHSAKYLPRDSPKRLFEEERFLFPESYGVNRVRLLVRDPDWVFAYWDVSPETMKGLASSLGERAFALSRLTLRVLDPGSGGMSDILLPPGARWWYIRTDAARRTYRAEIGITLPSGEFRQLAESNAVVTPRVGPSRERARRRLSYRGAGEVLPEQAEAAGNAERGAGLASDPWTGGGAQGERGGASDAFRPAGGRRADRPGASDTFRR